MRNLCLVMILFSFALSSNTQMMRVSTRAIMSYPTVKKTSRSLVKIVKKNTVGDNEEYLGILVPFVTGEVRYQSKDSNLYYNFRDQSVGARYIYRF